MERDGVPVALVTGASSGIGWCVAKVLAASGYRVAATARRVDRLSGLVEEIGRVGGVAQGIPADLTSESEREALVAKVRERFGRIDVLVNNAGLGWIGWQSEMPARRRGEILAVNVDAVVHLTSLVLPDMLARRSGHIVNVASVAGDLVLPTRTLYGATKALVQAFSEGLYRETRGTGVWVTAVNPGPVRTEFRHAAMGIPLDQRPDLESGIAPERVASVVVDVLRRPRSSAYVPEYFSVAPLAAIGLGWIVDRLGRRIAGRYLKALDRAK